MLIKNKDVEQLGLLIVSNIKRDFNDKYLSKNLINTIKTSRIENGFRIEIPAETYDVMEYLTNHIIIHNGVGSYADKLNNYGGEIGKIKTRNHIGYVDKAIELSIATWNSNMLALNGIESKRLK